MEKAENKADAERWLEVAGRLLLARDLVGSKRFAHRAQEMSSQTDGVDQILAITDVLLAAEKRINNHMDWYAILQLDRRSNDLEHIKRQYRRFAFLLHPDKNKYALADNAFKYVCDAWAFLSDPSKKTLYDKELNLLLKFDPIVLKNHQHQQVAPTSEEAATVRRSCREKRKTTKAAAAEAAAEVPNCEIRNEKLSSFWTVCPYCYNLYEYPRVYEDCCLKCQNCKRAFHAVVIPSPPPEIGVGKDLYYCCWAFFPIGFSRNGGKDCNWSSMFSVGAQMASTGDSYKEEDNVDVSDESWDVRGRKKAKTAKKSWKAGEASKRNVVNESVEGGARVCGNVAGPDKPTRKKTVARKSVIPIGKQVKNRSLGGRSDPDWVDMDLNVEVKPEVEEPRTCVVVDGVETGSIEKEATEGIGFFEGLDEILGSLPILSVPGEERAETAT